MIETAQRPWWRTLPRESVVVTLAALAALRLLVILINPVLTPPQWDEFIILANAKRIFNGALPYRDYFNHTPPGSEWFYAAVFWLSGGPNAGIARLVTQVAVVASGVLVYAALRRLALRPLAAALPGVALLVLWFPQWPIALHHWLALLPASAALLCWVLALRAEPVPQRVTALWAGAAGVLVIATALNVQTQAVIVGATILALPRLLRWSRPHLAPTRPALLWGGLAGGSALAAMAFVVYLAASGTFGLFIENSVLFPLFGYRQSGGPNDLRFLADIPYRLSIFAGLETSWWVRVMLAAGQICSALAGAAAALWLCLTALRALVERNPALAGRRWLDAGALLLPLVAAFTCLLARPDMLHLSFYGLLPTACAVLAVDGAARLRATYIDRCARSLLVLCGAIGLTAHLLLPLSQGAPVPPLFGRLSSIDPALDRLPAIDGEMVQNDPRLYFLRRFGIDHPGARLFAASQGAVAYFLGLDPAVSETLLLAPTSGYNSPAAYGRVAEQLESAAPELVMLTPLNDVANFLRPPPTAPIEVRQLAQVLQTQYAGSARIGDALILVRKDLVAAAAVPPPPAPSPHAQP